MRLTKDQRTRLFAGEPVELQHPASDNPPLLTGHSYRIERSEFRALVLRQRTTPEGWTAVLALDNHDQPRLLARGLGYTTSTVHALPDEPEAVDEATQATLTKQARERHEDNRTKDLVNRAKAVGLSVDELL